MSGDAKYINLYYNLVHQSATDFYKEIIKGPGGNMSYVPPWVPPSGGSNYPSHMIPNFHSSPPHHSSSGSHEPNSSKVYHELTSKDSPVTSTSNNMPLNKSLSSSSATSIPPSHSSERANATATENNNSSGNALSPTGHSSSHQVNYNNQNCDRSGTPPKRYQQEDTKVANFHNQDLVLGLPGPSSLDKRKYVRRSPTKFPPPEQLSAPVMYSFQGRGRPRKHWTHGTGLPTMIPVTHPSSSREDTDDDDESDENKPYKCNICMKGFKVKGGLQQHERTHSSDRPYICPDCGKLFRQPTHLQQHIRIHTGEKPYDCSFCDKSFRQRTILNQHLRIHTGEKPYICIECGKQFRQKAILDQHYRSHLGEKPYACPHPSCRKHFREMASLISHMKCHKDVPDPKIVLHQTKHFIKEEAVENYPNACFPDRVQGMESEQRNDSLKAESHYHHTDSSPEKTTVSSSGEQKSPPSMSEQLNNAEGPLHLAMNSHSAPIMGPSQHMSMANLIPYPHSIFPATSYVMSAPSVDPKQYPQQMPGSQNHLQTRTSQ